MIWISCYISDFWHHTCKSNCVAFSFLILASFYLQFYCGFIYKWISSKPSACHSLLFYSPIDALFDKIWRLSIKEYSGKENMWQSLFVHCSKFIFSGDIWDTYKSFKWSDWQSPGNTRSSSISSCKPSKMPYLSLNPSKSIC